MENHQPFRGRDACASGRTTRRRLAGRGVRRLWPDVHVDADAVVDLGVRARAAALLVPGAVVGGHAAAELLGARCGPRDADIDLMVGRRRVRAHPGLRIHQDRLRPDEIQELDGLPVTTPLRTAFDLARRLDHVEAVVAMDALARIGRFVPEAVLAHRAEGGSVRGLRRIPGVVAEADRRAESAMETRTRLVLVAHGVPTPELQYEVIDTDGVLLGRLDIAWPEFRVAVEYQGDHHRVDPRQYAADLRRSADLAAAGWLIIPVRAADVFRRPDVLAERVLSALAHRA